MGREKYEMEDVRANAGGLMQRDLYPSLRARSGSFRTDCKLWSGSWLKDPITNCAVWGSDLRGDNLISWSGDCRDDKPAPLLNPSNMPKATPAAED